MAQIARISMGWATALLLLASQTHRVRAERDPIHLPPVIHLDTFSLPVDKNGVAIPLYLDNCILNRECGDSPKGGRAINFTCDKSYKVFIVDDEQSYNDYTVYDGAYKNDAFAVTCVTDGQLSVPIYSDQAINYVVANTADDSTFVKFTIELVDMTLQINADKNCSNVECSLTQGLQCHTASCFWGSCLPFEFADEFTECVDPHGNTVGDYCNAVGECGGTAAYTFRLKLTAPDDVVADWGSPQTFNDQYLRSLFIMITKNTTLMSVFTTDDFNTVVLDEVDGSSAYVVMTVSAYRQFGETELLTKLDVLTRFAAFQYGDAVSMASIVVAAVEDVTFLTSTTTTSITTTSTTKTSTTSRTSTTLSTTTSSTQTVSSTTSIPIVTQTTTTHTTTTSTGTTSTGTTSTTQGTVLCLEMLFAGTITDLTNAVLKQQVKTEIAHRFNETSPATDALQDRFTKSINDGADTIQDVIFSEIANNTIKAKITVNPFVLVTLGAIKAMRESLETQPIVFLGDGVNLTTALTADSADGAQLYTLLSPGCEALQSDLLMPSTTSTTATTFTSTSTTATTTTTTMTTATTTTTTTIPTTTTMTTTITTTKTQPHKLIPRQII
eukprot:m.197523 g.197523  ORF g.197523 m.197523 type:complete len:611 (+) comp32661_c4_seq2:364-2196(+)